jgi:hypothetical protein
MLCDPPELNLISIIFLFYTVLLGVYCDIYQSSYNISLLNSSPPQSYFLILKFFSLGFSGYCTSSIDIKSMK